MTDALYVPHPAPPPLARLEANPVMMQAAELIAAWRAGRNMLNVIHPESAERRWRVARAGGLRMITVNDAGLARRILSENAANYRKSHMYHALLADMIGPTASLISDGETARFKRRLIAPAFNARALKRLEGVVEAHVAAALDRWAAAPDGVVTLSAEAPRLAMEIAMDAFFSATLGERAARLAALLDETMDAAGSPSVADVLDLPGWVPRKSRRVVRRNIAEIDALLYELIDARRETATDHIPEDADMLDVLVRARDPETGARLSRQEVRNETITLFLAGHETTALSIAWGFDRLAREPAMQAAVASEAAAAEAERGRPVGAAEARGVPLIAETYDEMLRLYPPAFVIGRIAVAADRFEDLDIRPEDQFLIATFLLHRNERYWDRPGAFDPTRFRSGPKSPAFMPFGAGPRNCVGMAMARMEAHLLLARLLARFRLEPVGPPPEPLGKVTLRTRDPVRVRLVPAARENSGPSGE